MGVCARIRTRAKQGQALIYQRRIRMRSHFRVFLLSVVTAFGHTFDVTGALSRPDHILIGSLM